MPVAQNWMEFTVPSAQQKTAQQVPLSEDAIAPAQAQPVGGPLLGRLGQILELLFPAVPARRPWSVRRAWVAVANAAAVVAGAGVLLVRQAGTPSWSTMWAEDGSVFLPRALFHPVSSIFREYAGYLQLVPQLIADAVARFPMRDAAAGFAVAGALVASSCAVFVFYAGCGHIVRPGLRALLACSVVLLPTAVIEIANSGVDAPWYLMYALFWALLWRPASRRGMVLAGFIAFMTMASNILNVLYLPLVVARVLALPRPREQAVTFGWLAGIAFQVLGIVQSREPHGIGPVPAGLHFYGQHVLVAAVAGWPLARGLQDATGTSASIALAAVVVGAVAIWAARSGGPRLRVFVIAAIAMGLILSIIPALVRAWVAPAMSNAIWVPGSRYTASAILLIDAVAITGVDAYLRAKTIPFRQAWRCGPVLILIIGLGIGWASSFRYNNVRSAGPPWSRTYIRYQRALPPQRGLSAGEHPVTLAADRPRHAPASPARRPPAVTGPSSSDLCVSRPAHCCAHPTRMGEEDRCAAEGAT
jgi:hypothetical protein